MVPWHEQTRLEVVASEQVLHMRKKTAAASDKARHRRLQAHELSGRIGCRATPGAAAADVLQQLLPAAASNVGVAEGAAAPGPHGRHGACGKAPGCAGVYGSSRQDAAAGATMAAMTAAAFMGC